MVKLAMDDTPRELEPMNPAGRDTKVSSMNEEKIQMKKQLGLLEGVAIILGIIFGSGMKQFRSTLQSSSLAWSIDRIEEKSYDLLNVFKHLKNFL